MIGDGALASCWSRVVFLWRIGQGGISEHIPPTNFPLRHNPIFSPLTF
jgi:hypothetical protein